MALTAVGTAIQSLKTELTTRANRNVTDAAAINTLQGQVTSAQATVTNLQGQLAAAQASTFSPEDKAMIDSVTAFLAALPK